MSMINLMQILKLITIRQFFIFSVFLSLYRIHQKHKYVSNSFLTQRLRGTERPCVEKILIVLRIIPECWNINVLDGCVTPITFVSTNGLKFQTIICIFQIPKLCPGL
jgi:hypothetical protein